MIFVVTLKENKIKILISSYDVGAAKTLSKFNKYIKENSLFDTLIVCSKASSYLFIEEGCRNLIVDDSRAKSNDQFKKKKNFRKS